MVHARMLGCCSWCLRKPSKHGNKDGDFRAQGWPGESGTTQGTRTAKAATDGGLSLSCGVAMRLERNVLIRNRVAAAGCPTQADFACVGLFATTATNLDASPASPSFGDRVGNVCANRQPSIRLAAL